MFQLIFGLLQLYNQIHRLLSFVLEQILLLRDFEYLLLSQVQGFIEGLGPVVISFLQ